MYVCMYTCYPVQNILKKDNTMKKSSKVRQNPKTLISTFYNCLFFKCWYQKIISAEEAGH